MRASFRFCLPLTAALFGFGGLAGHVSAGDHPRPATVLLAQDDSDAQPPADDPSSNAALLVRISRLEDRLRTLNGEIEQLQFQNRKLEDELRKMSQDVDFRFQDLGRGTGGAKPAPQKRGDAADSVGAPAVAAAAVATTIPATPEATTAEPAKTAASTARHGDAFDPSADPAAPGAPKPLGTTAASDPLPPRVAAAASKPSGLTLAPAGPPHAPLDLTPNSVAPKADAPPERTAAVEPAPDLRGTGSIPPAGNAGTRGDYDSAFNLYKAGQYDAATGAFTDFIGKYPKDRAIADATYFLGESYARLGRQREAAEQFLKLTTDYNRSSHAPDALLRLGIALNALGAKEQACATYQEVDHKYPTASPDVRAGVERELKRARC